MDILPVHWECGTVFRKRPSQVQEMTITREPKKHSGQPTVYQIRIEGQLSPDWSDWLEGLTITLADNGDTLFTGPVVDQAALFGLLKKVRDLGIPLVSVNPAASAMTDGSEGEG